MDLPEFLLPGTGLQAMDIGSSEAFQWAERTFGLAELGDQRRVGRLVAMAEGAARRPAGPVTRVFGSSAEREGAFRLLENRAVPAKAVAQAAFTSTARAVAGERLVYVPVDGSSLTLSDRAQRREIGRVGNTRVKSRGLHVMTALAIDDAGVALGVLDQIWWARSQQPRVRPRHDKCVNNSHLRKETRFWLEALTNCDDQLTKHAAGAQAWYQLDRGADCWPVFRLALERKLLVTVRASHDRRLLEDDGRLRYLREKLKRQPVLGRFDVEIPPRPDRDARTARLTVRACTVRVHARTKSKGREVFVLNAVLAEESGRSGTDRLCWVLLTTHAVNNFEHARAVLDGYTLRWRVEEFHRAWKRGGCNIEESQLQSQSALIKWATILATVAARAVRLAYLVRNAAPDLPASAEFSEYEIDAAFLYVRRKRDRRKRVLLREIIDIIADVGGFAHKYSDRLPGPTILGRGLERIENLALGLKNQAEMR